MLDPETFMKNSPFQVSSNISYNLSNTTPDLLKFSLQEHARAQVSSPSSPDSRLVESSFNNHLRTILRENSFSIDEDTDGNDDFSVNDQASDFSSESSSPSESQKAVANSRDSRYSNMRILIENSVFDSSRISPKSVLSLSTLKRVKADIAEKTDLKEYLQEKCQLSSQFCATLFSAPESSSSQLDAQLLLKVLKQVNEIQSQLVAVSQELDQLKLQLNNHNLVCLVSGYIEDVRLSNGSRSPLGEPSPKDKEPESSRAFEMLFAHIVSLAAQKSTPLPEYPSTSNDTLQERIDWATDCISALVSTSTLPSSAATDVSDITGIEDTSLVKDHSFLSAAPYRTYQKSNSSEKVLSEYKLALNDLRFSQEYFMKEYEYLKENSLKTISEYRKKNTALEKEVSRVRGGLPKSPSRDSLKSKDQEIHRLRKELNGLKIDMMGSKSPATPSSVSPSLLSSAEHIDGNAFNFPTSPTHQKSTSTAILRKEFKKIVEGIQDQYEIELEQERAKRRELESQIQQSEKN